MVLLPNFTKTCKSSSIENSEETCRNYTSKIHGCVKPRLQLEKVVSYLATVMTTPTVTRKHPSN